jgi:hypothetical protein
MQQGSIPTAITAARPARGLGEKPSPELKMCVCVCVRARARVGGGGAREIIFAEGKVSFFFLSTTGIPRSDTFHKVHEIWIEKVPFIVSQHHKYKNQPKTVKTLPSPTHLYYQDA